MLYLTKQTQAFLFQFKLAIKSIMINTDYKYTHGDILHTHLTYPIYLILHIFKIHFNCCLNNVCYCYRYHYRYMFN